MDKKNIVQNVKHNEYSKTVCYDIKSNNFTFACNKLLFSGVLPPYPIVYSFRMIKYINNS